jgi:hypothetical protein
MADPDTEKPADGDAPAKDVSATEAGAKPPASRPLEAAKVASAPRVEAAAPVVPPAPTTERMAGAVAAIAPGAPPTTERMAAFERPAPPAPPAERTSTKEQVAAAAFAPSSRSKVKASPPSTAERGSGPLAAYEAIARSARLPDLVAVAQKILSEAATARRAGWELGAKVTAAADDAKLSRSDADTSFGNALKVLGEGPEGEAERSLAAALWAHAIAEARRDDDDRLAGDVLWLATHSAFDATPLLDRALGDEADDVWTAIGDRVRRIDEGRGTALGRGEAIVGCAALMASESARARKVAADLAARVHDPTLSRLLGAAADVPLREVHLEGEALPAPRGPVATAILALTGILFVMHAARLVARLALAYRTPAEVSLSDAGVRMRTRTEMLGRTLRDREHVIVRSGLVRITREVRYPRAAFYAGLLALALGSYIGVRAFVDGVRSASPSLLLTGLVVVSLGIGADFLFGSLLPGARGRVRIAFVPRTGKALCVGDIDAHRADAALSSVLKS